MATPPARKISSAVAAATGRKLDPDSAHATGGGSISRAYRLCGSDGDVFVKVNDIERLAMFEAEAQGLAELAATATIRVPEVIAVGTHDTTAFLALEYLSLEPADDSSAARLGESLASLHRCADGRFGWHRDNTIGTTPQVNATDDSWIDFFARHRLGYQLSLARARGAHRLVSAGEKLLADLPAFFEDFASTPRLLHGDLWAGNWGVAGGEPVVFDPAVYYGDPETDIAMTELFGGFPSRFYAAYRHSMPEAAGAARRRELYRLYHVLNHDHLFGGGYASQAERIMERLLGTV